MGGCYNEVLLYVHTELQESNDESSSSEVHTSSSGTVSSSSQASLSLSDNSDSCEATPDNPVLPTASKFPAFKIVGDNIDKYVKPREMRLDAQAKSLNFFNYYAVKCRIDASNLDDKPSLPDFSSFQMDKLLPTKDDDDVLASNFIIHITRVLRKHFPFFEKFASGVKKHIKHDHYKETSAKSEVVGVNGYLSVLIIFWNNIGTPWNSPKV